MPRTLVDPRLIHAYLLDEGGWHTHEEICEALGIEQPHWRASVSGTLTALRRRGVVAMRSAPGGDNLYGVTLSCRPWEATDGHGHDRIAGVGRGADAVDAVGVRP